MRVGLVALTLAWGACDSADGTDPQETPDDTVTEVDTGLFEGPWVETTDNGDGTFTTNVVAVSTVDKVFFSFADGEVAVQADNPDAAWDLAFQREHILINGGISGEGGIEAAELAGVAFDDVAYAPVGGWAVDLPDNDDEDDEDQEVLYTWFAYNFDKHILEPTQHTFVVRTPQGDVRMWVETYYLDPEAYTGSGYPKFHWAWITEPGPLSVEGDAWRVDATSPAYLNLREQIALSPGASSTSWDVMVDGATVRLNGGVSGTGERAAARVDAAFDAVTETPDPAAFTTDADDGDGGVDYAIDAFEDDGGNLVPVDATWVVSRPGDTTDKLRFTSATGPKGEAGQPLMQVAPLP